MVLSFNDDIAQDSKFIEYENKINEGNFESKYG